MEPPCGTLLDGGLVHQHPKDKPNPNTQTPYPITEASYSEALARLYTQSHHHKNLMQTQKQITNHPFIPTTRNTTHNGAKALIFNSNEYYGQIAAKCKFTLVGKSSKPMPKLVEIVAKFLEKISTKGEVELVARTNRIIFINCSNEDDCKSIYFRRVIDFSDDVQMWLQRWNPDFEPDHDMPFAPIWVQLPDLPYHLHDWECLKRIGSLLGEPLSMDAATKSRNRPSLAKIRVDVDLTKPLTRQIWIGHEEEGAPLKGFFQKIEYDFVPKFCTHCKRLGHSLPHCRAVERNNHTNVPSNLEKVPARAIKDENKKLNLAQMERGKNSNKQEMKHIEQKKGAAPEKENQRKSGEKDQQLPTTQKQVEIQPLVAQAERERKGKKVAVEPQVVLIEKGNCSKEKKGKKPVKNQKKMVWRWRPKENQQQANVEDASHGPKHVSKENVVAKKKKRAKKIPKHMLGPKIGVLKQRFEMPFFVARKHVKPKFPKQKMKLHRRLTRKREKGRAKTIRSSASAKFKPTESRRVKCKPSESSAKEQGKELSTQGFYQNTKKGPPVVKFKEKEVYNCMVDKPQIPNLIIALHLMKQIDAAADRRSLTFPPYQEPKFQFCATNTIASVPSSSIHSMQDDNAGEETVANGSTQVVVLAGEDEVNEVVAEANSGKVDEYSKGGQVIEEIPRKSPRENRTLPASSAPPPRSKAKLNPQVEESEEEMEDATSEFDPEEEETVGSPDGKWQQVPQPKWKQRMKKKLERREENKSICSAPITRSRAKKEAQISSHK